MAERRSTSSAWRISVSTSMTRRACCISRPSTAATGDGIFPSKRRAASAIRISSSPPRRSPASAKPTPATASTRTSRLGVCTGTRQSATRLSAAASAASWSAQRNTAAKVWGPSRPIENPVPRSAAVRRRRITAIGSDQAAGPSTSVSAAMPRSSTTTAAIGTRSAPCTRSLSTTATRPRPSAGRPAGRDRRPASTSASATATQVSPATVSEIQPATNEAAVAAVTTTSPTKVAMSVAMPDRSRWSSRCG